MTDAHAAHNWQDTYARLEHTRQRLEASSTMSPEETRQHLQERARTLARPLANASPAPELLHLVLFTLAGTHYGIEAVHVLEVLPLGELTPVPCTPAYIRGVINHRGRLLTILDLGHFLTAQGLSTAPRVVAVEAGGMAFGMLADAVPGSLQVEMQELVPPPVSMLHHHQVCIRGVTGDGVAVLDLEALVHDPRLIVDETVG